MSVRLGPLVNQVYKYLLTQSENIAMEHLQINLSFANDTCELKKMTKALGFGHHQRFRSMKNFCIVFAGVSQSISVEQCVAAGEVDVTSHRHPEPQRSGEDLALD